MIVFLHYTVFLFSFFILIFFSTFLFINSAYLQPLFDDINQLPAAQEPGNSGIAFLMLLSWKFLIIFNEIKIKIKIKIKMKVSSMEDIGGLQWATDALLEGSVYSVSPHDLEVFLIPLFFPIFPFLFLFPSFFIN